jgi:serine/threonine-protein kinase haspin
MPRKATYGKRSKATKAERLFAELPQSPIRKKPQTKSEKTQDDPVAELVEHLSTLEVNDCPDFELGIKQEKENTPIVTAASPQDDAHDVDLPQESPPEIAEENVCNSSCEQPTDEDTDDTYDGTTLRVLFWEDVCPPGDKIEKIAEASYAEVYRVSNDRGTSIIKVIRLRSPIKAKTKTQVRSGLVDEEPHAEEDINGELQISEWLADIPGFVVYKERYVVQGKATRQLLETHQTFHRKMKRQDPGRAQFYPSPSRYLDDTRFLVVELGDAGTALEDWKLTSETQLWDIFFLVAIALARAEDLAMFEVSFLRACPYHHPLLIRCPAP